MERKMPYKTLDLGTVNPEKVQRYMELMEANIEEEVKVGGIDKMGRPIPRGHPNWKLQWALEKDLTIAERREVARLSKIKARQAWENGDNEAKKIWGGW
jgi:hypothetical protein